MAYSNLKTGVAIVSAATGVVQNLSNFEVLIKSGALKYGMLAGVCIGIMLVLKYIIGQGNLLSPKVAGVLIKVAVPINIVCVISGFYFGGCAISKFVYYAPPVVVVEAPKEVEKVEESTKYLFPTAAKIAPTLN